MRFENTKKKYEIQSKVENFKRHPEDVGSPLVQIARLTFLIHSLTNHLKENKKDFHGTRGLKKMSAKRKKLLLYLKKNSITEYHKIIKELNL
jgi:small subunit ribosomal protein S15